MNSRKRLSGESWIEPWVYDRVCEHAPTRSRRLGLEYVTDEG
jgi:hypothetical protein